MEDIRIDLKAADNSGWGFGIAAYINTIRISGLNGNYFTIGTWLRDKDGQYDCYEDYDNILITSDNYAYNGPFRVFYYDSYLMDIYGEKNLELTLCIGLYDKGADGSRDADPIAWAEIPLNFKSEDRGKPLTMDSITMKIVERGKWNPQKSRDRLEPPMVDQSVLPSSDYFFTFYHSFKIFPDHQRMAKSMIYLKDGDRMLVSDDHATVYLFDINTGEQVWEKEIYKDNYFDIYINDIRPDEKEFITTTPLQHSEATPSLNIHRMSAGYVGRKINEKSLYLDAERDLRGEEMIPLSARYSDDGKEIYATWHNLRTDHGMFDYSLKVYDAKTYKKKWEWQILDPRGITLDTDGRHMALKILPIQGKYAEFLLFSETGEVRHLTYDIIKAAMKEPNVLLKPKGKLLYTWNAEKGYYPQYFLKTGNKSLCLTAICDDQKMGRMAMLDVFTGKISWSVDWEVKISALMQRGEGRYVFARSGNYWNAWDQKTYYLIASGAYFYQPDFGYLALNPGRREMAFTYYNYIYFLRESKRKTYKMTKKWQSTGIYVNDNIELNCWGNGDIELAVSPESVFSGGTAKYADESNYIFHKGGPYTWEKFYFDRHSGREIYIRSDDGTEVEIWGGLSKPEFSRSIKALREGLPRW
ncbi:MAG: hypothetical protein JW969_03500 [Spirochaetales bacterium]|nr:hypothetical protein [Spirochaetales bacterium]